MHTELPLVSVLTCTYNAGTYLVPALRSITQQTYTHLEIIVLDDGSTDGSVEAARQIVGDPRIRWLRQSNRGRPAALNRAIEEVHGKYYTIQDADDVSHPERIQKLVGCMEQSSELAGVFSGHRIILDGVAMAPRFRHLTSSECRRLIDRYAIPAHDPTGLFRMSLVGTYRYDESLPYTEAVDYILRIGEAYPLMVLGECLYSYRIHPQSITRRDPHARRKYVIECCKRACERRGVDFATQFPGAKESPRKMNSSLDNNLAAQFIESALDQRRVGQWLGAVATGLRCARLHPLDPHYYKSLVYAVSPQWLVKRIRRNGAGW